MTSSFAATLVLVWTGLTWSSPAWPGLRLGMFRVTAYGLCAAAGLVVSMALAQRLARQGQRTPLDPEAVWDAGLVAVISCFVTSRLLLILRDPVTFVHYPLLVLALPSLTYGGIALAALVVLVNLRRKRLALRPMLDIFAAPAAVLAASLELGHWLEGSEAGMPTTLPWGVREPWASTLPVHPVALYGVSTALLLAGVLWLTGRRRNGTRQANEAQIPGRLAAGALVASGILAFGLSFCAQPLPYVVTLWLEPGQWTALGAILGGTLLWTFSTRVPPGQAAESADEVSSQGHSQTRTTAALQHAEVR